MKSVVCLWVLVLSVLATGCGGGGGSSAHLPSNPKPSFALSVNKTGTGSGTVTSNPAGINCGTDCSESYQSGTSVTLTATAANGSAFAGWSGACSGTGVCTVTMSANLTVTATFDQTSTIESVAVSPSAITLAVEQTQIFSVEMTGTGEFNASVRWSVNDAEGGNSTVGTISDSGLYTAPLVVPNPATVTVKAVSKQDSSKFGTAVVTITATALVSLEWAEFSHPSHSSGLMTVTVDSQNNITAGGFKANDGNNDFVAVAVSYDSNRQVRWTADFGQQNSSFRSVVVHPDGDSVFFAGRIGTFPNFASVFLAKYDSLGQPQFERSCQVVLNQGIGASVMRLSSSRLYIGTESNSGKPRVITSDLEGNVDCQSGFAVRESGNSFGGLLVGSDHVVATGMFNDNQGNFSIAAYVAKFTLDGVPLWELVFDDVALPKVIESTEGSQTFIYVSGTQLGPTVNQSAAAKFTLDGVRRDAALPKVLKSTEGLRMFVHAPGTQLQFRPTVSQNVNENAVHRFFLVKLDQDGNEIWRRTWDGDNGLLNQSNFAMDLFLSPQGDVVVVGEITELTALDVNQGDFGAIAYGPDGDVLWKLRHDFQGQDDFCFSGAFDLTGRLILVGNSFRSSVDGDSVVAVFRVP